MTPEEIFALINGALPAGVKLVQGFLTLKNDSGKVTVVQLYEDTDNRIDAARERWRRALED